MSFRFRLGVAFLLVFSFAFVFIIEKTMTTEPRPESQSAFFQHYDPTAAINTFRDASLPLAAPRSVESSGSWGFVTHRASISPEFVIAADQQAPLLAALQHDAETALKNAGAQVIDEHAEKPAGFRIGYQLGASRGAISEKPAAVTGPQAPGKTTMKLDIMIQEMWSESASKEKKPKP
jgi:hypothetical protein